jgi:hypothetical protein
MGRHPGSPLARSVTLNTTVIPARNYGGPRIGKADPDWPDWYAKYMVAEKAGQELPL